MWGTYPERLLESMKYGIVPAGGIDGKETTSIFDLTPL